MLMKRLMTSMLVVAVLGACASNPDARIKQDSGCNPGSVGGVHSLGDFVFALTFGMVFAYSCEGMSRLVDGNPPPSLLEGDVYHSGDGAFSVKLPVTPSISDAGSYSLIEHLTRSEDYIFVLPNHKGEGHSAYLVDVLRKLDAKDADLSPKEFLGDMTRIKQLMALHPISSEDGPPLVHEEVLTLDGKPALFQAYSLLLVTDDKDNDATEFFGSGSKTLNLLLYVVKSHDEAAILGIAWPGDCATCATGPESAVRKLNPDLDAFVSSFRLADKND
jgi:hypothetical protein